MTASAFSGFLPQITGRLGPVRWVEAATAHGGNRGFAVFYLGAPGGEVGTAVTNGLRFQPLGVLHPVELCCSLLTEQEETAHRLVVQVARMLLAGAIKPVSGTVLPGEGPLAPGSAMVGVVCAGHPFTDAEFDVVRNAQGRIELQIITLIPASAAELELAMDQGTDALFERWETMPADLADLARPSAV
jgi:hypothetical protein